MQTPSLRPSTRTPCAENWHLGAASAAFGDLVADLEALLAPLLPSERTAAAHTARGTVEKHIGRGDLLDGMRYVFCCSNYSRVLLHADPAGRFSVLGLVWPPGCVTPVHAHHTWCALGLHRGTLEEETFRARHGIIGDAGRPVATRALRPGESLCDPSDGRFVHRLANRSEGFAVSLHVYGVPAEAVSDGVNRIFAPA